jgi:hypothetical protein
MTRKLEQLFDLPSTAPETDSVPAINETKSALIAIDDTIDKIDSALPAVRGLDASDSEMDELADKATKTFDDLMDLGMNVDSRFASEIFAVAGTMLGHALTAKTAKMNKKLKMIELQMKKMKLDRDMQGDEGPAETAQGQVLNRNDLLERLLATRTQNSKSS